jgi:type III secretion protein L
MSGIIKSGAFAELAQVRPLPPAAASASVVILSRHEEERDRLRARVSVLEAEIQQRDALIETIRAAAGDSFAEGRALGCSEGVTQAENRETERLALLGESLQRSEAALREKVAALERLAPLLARECLEILFAAPKFCGKAVRRIIEAQMARIEKSAVLSIAVSRADFTSEESLAAVAEGLAVQASEDLPPGACSINLRLGTLEVGLNQQWPALRALLAEMAEPEAVR